MDYGPNVVYNIMGTNMNSRPVRRLPFYEGEVVAVNSLTRFLLPSRPSGKYLVYSHHGQTREDAARVNQTTQSILA